MSYLLQYLIKFSISLAVLYVFYRAVLRPLTFYQWNRFYLAGYALLSFVIPFIDINVWMTGAAAQNQLINIIPVITNYTPVITTVTPQHVSLLQRLTLVDWMVILFCAGVLVMFTRLVIQYLSLRRIRAGAVLLESQPDVLLYETDAAISPFSFGKSIYFNRSMHDSEALERIIRHEFVHVKQKHTIDLMIGELLCIVNWYNPFAWLIRYSIRQNLEFIADNNVLENGFDKKEYQYLLLKVMGVAKYSIANNFNFSNLKKRIAMMNKMKSARVHLTKFFFVLPLLLIILVAFRSSRDEISAVNSKQVQTDTVPPPPPPAKVDLELREVRIDEKIREVRVDRVYNVPYNKKGYKITILDDNGECLVIVKDKSKKVVKALPLTEWNESKGQYEAQYGEILVPPPPPPPARPRKVMVPAAGEKEIRISDKQAVVELETGKEVIYNLEKPVEKAAFEKKYGKVVPLPPSPAGKPSPVISIRATQDAVLEAPHPATSPRPAVRVRGASVINDDVLFVVDGVMGGKEIIESVSPNDIDRIDVLKDKAATSAFGDKAKDGVIIITTKKAKKAAPKEPITIKSDSISFKNIPVMIHGELKVDDKVNIVTGNISIGKIGTTVPLVFYNGKKINDVQSFATGVGRYTLASLDSKEAVAKYGADALNGVVEINSL